jgi:hypothetical protein
MSEIHEPEETAAEIESGKTLTFQSLHEGKFQVVDAKGNKLAEGFERPDMPCYVSAKIPGPNEGQIIDGFGRETDTIEEAEKKVRALFRKHGFLLQ